MKNKWCNHMKLKQLHFLFFIIIKGAATLAALFIMLLFFSNIRHLVWQIRQYGLYSPLADYYGISVSPDIDTSEENMQKLDDALVEFFLKTNDSESLLLSVDTQILLYDEGFITRDELENKDFVITVNEAYLSRHPIYDTKGNPVVLPENKQENYLLVPEKYRSQEQEFKAYYEENNTFLRYYIDDLKTMGIEAAHQKKHDIIPTNIIYISNGQSFKVYNMDPGGKYRCTLTDPLISVITNENVSPAQIPAYTTHRDYLVKADTPQRLEQLNQIIRETGLTAFLRDFSPVCQEYFSSLKMNLTAISVQLMIALALQTISFLLAKHTIKKAEINALITANSITWITAACFFIFLLYFLHFPLTFMAILSTISLLLADTLLFRTVLHKNKPISLNQETAYQK